MLRDLHLVSKWYQIVFVLLLISVGYGYFRLWIQSLFSLALAISWFAYLGISGVSFVECKKEFMSRESLVIDFITIILLMATGGIAVMLATRLMAVVRARLKLKNEN